MQRGQSTPPSAGKGWGGGRRRGHRGRKSIPVARFGFIPYHHQRRQETVRHGTTSSGQTDRSRLKPTGSSLVSRKINGKLPSVKGLKCCLLTSSITIGAQLARSSSGPSPQERENIGEKKKKTSMELLWRAKLCSLISAPIVVAPPPPHPLSPLRSLSLSPPVTHSYSFPSYVKACFLEARGIKYTGINWQSSVSRYYKYNSSCETEDFVETHLCKLCVILYG